MEERGAGGETARGLGWEKMSARELEPPFLSFNVVISTYHMYLAIRYDKITLWFKG